MTLQRVSTGIDGLDSILNRGLVERQNALVRGPPGAGKSIIGLHFLADGVKNGETSLFVNLGEPVDYIRETASAFGLDFDAVHYKNLAPTHAQFDESGTYTLFSPAEVEQPGYIRELRETIEDLTPDRVLLDPITEFRFLTNDDHQFRTQILGLLDLLKEAGATVLLTSQAADTSPDDDLQFLVDTVISLAVHTDHRDLQVTKFRRSSFQHGPHTYAIDDEGITVWPTLPSPETDIDDVVLEPLPTGVNGLDALLDGGLTTGTITFISGPTGVGKTTTGAQILSHAAANGKRVVLYEFEESKNTLLHRSSAIGIPLAEQITSGDVTVVEIPPDKLTVDEFAAMVRADVDDGADVVMIDGTQGYEQNLRGASSNSAKYLLRLGRYLKSRGVTTIIAHEVHAITGRFQVSEDGTSNLTDTIVFIRHIEYKGDLKKVIGTLKKRTGDFEHHLRELEITESGLTVGEPLPHLRGILTGTPDWRDEIGTENP